MSSRWPARLLSVLCLVVFGVIAAFGVNSGFGNDEIDRPVGVLVPGEPTQRTVAPFQTELKGFSLTTVARFYSGPISGHRAVERSIER